MPTCTVTKDTTSAPSTPQMAAGDLIMVRWGESGSVPVLCAIVGASKDGRLRVAKWNGEQQRWQSPTLVELRRFEREATADDRAAANYGGPR